MDPFVLPAPARWLCGVAATLGVSIGVTPWLQGPVAPTASGERLAVMLYLAFLMLFFGAFFGILSRDFAGPRGTLRRAFVAANGCCMLAVIVAAVLAQSIASWRFDRDLARAATIFDAARSGERALEANEIQARLNTLDSRFKFYVEARSEGLSLHASYRTGRESDRFSTWLACWDPNERAWKEWGR